MVVRTAACFAVGFLLSLRDVASQLSVFDMDTCVDAAGPRLVNDVASPGTTVGKTLDVINDGYCGVTIDQPGMWWWVNGTGTTIRASTCDKRTEIKTKISVFTGVCGDLSCVDGSDLPDYGCGVLQRGADGDAWGTISTSIDFETNLGQYYYLLVQQIDESSGVVWLKFREPSLPQNDACINAVGPVPRDLTAIQGTTEDGSLSRVPAGYCGNNLSLYPGSWYQITGTGGRVSVMACSEFNFNGFYFSVYNGAYCSGMSCVDGSYDLNIEDANKCTFGQALRPMTKFTFDTKDRDRYFIYIHYAETNVDKPTSDFRFFVDDGDAGKGGSGPLTKIKFARSSKPLEDQRDEESKSAAVVKVVVTLSPLVVSLLMVTLQL